MKSFSESKDMVECELKFPEKQDYKQC